MPYGSKIDKSPISSEYSGVINRFGLDDEYSMTQPGFTYTFPFRFAGNIYARYSEIASYDEVVSKSGLDDEYDTTQTRYIFPSSY